MGSRGGTEARHRAECKICGTDRGYRATGAQSNGASTAEHTAALQDSTEQRRHARVAQSSGGDAVLQVAGLLATFAWSGIEHLIFYW